MSSTYCFLGNINLRDITEPSSSVIVPLLAGIRLVVGTDFMIEPYLPGAADAEGGAGTVKFAFVDQACASDDLQELSRGVSDELAHGLEAILGWRPSVDIQALWWGP